MLNDFHQQLRATNNSKIPKRAADVLLIHWTTKNSRHNRKDLTADLSSAQHKHLETVVSCCTLYIGLPTYIYIFVDHQYCTIYLVTGLYLVYICLDPAAC